jgi:hypothetical protein
MPRLLQYKKIKVLSSLSIREESLKVVYPRQYFYRIHNEELQRLLNKDDIEDYIEPVIHYQLLERTRLQEVICHFPKGLSPKGIIRRRIRAIDLMEVLCSRQEEPRPKRRSVVSRESSSETSSDGESPKEDLLSESSPNPELFPPHLRENSVYLLWQDIFPACEDDGPR